MLFRENKTNSVEELLEYTNWLYWNSEEVQQPKFKGQLGSRGPSPTTSFCSLGFLMSTNIPNLPAEQETQSLFPLWQSGISVY